MQISFKFPLTESNIIKSFQNSSNNLLEISMWPEHLLSLIQNGGLSKLSNFNIKINIVNND